MPRPKLTVPTIYPLDRNLNKDWYVKFPQPNGAPPIKKYGRLSSCSTLEQKLAEAARIILEMNGYVQNSADKISALIVDIDTYLSYKKTGLKAKSKQSYTTHYNGFCTWYRKHGANMQPEQIGLEFQKHLADVEKVSNTTNNNYRDTLRAVFTKLVKANKFPINPFDLTDPLDERRQTYEWFREEDIEALAAAINPIDPQLWLACRLQFYCFIRPDCELNELFLSDIQIADKRIRIRAEISKSGRFDEYVQIPDHMLSELSALVGFYPSYFSLFAHGGKPGRWKLPKAHLYRRHKVILDRLKFPPGYTFYSWKNTGAVMMYKKGISILDISDMMRHKSLDYTKYYFQTLGFHERSKNVNDKLLKI